MNTRPPASAAPVDELVERLRRSVTDTTAFCPKPVYRNPDGPEAADQLTIYARRVAEAGRLLKRYRTETPLGNQPHMIAHEADEWLATGEQG